MAVNTSVNYLVFADFSHLQNIYLLKMFEFFSLSGTTTANANANHQQLLLWRHVYYLLHGYINGG